MREDDAKTFELAAFDLRYGDRVYDEIDRTLSVHDGQKLVPANQFVIDPKRAGKLGRAPRQGIRKRPDRDAATAR